MGRKFAAGLALAALGLVVASLAQQAVCGAMVVEENAPGQPPRDARCVPAVHPFSLPVATMVVVGAAGAMAGRAWVPLALGLTLMVLGVPLVFSLGMTMFGAGALLVAAGASLGRPRPIRQG